jgi:hypothetical protein
LSKTSFIYAKPVSLPLVGSLRLVRNPSEERFQTRWNDKMDEGFWTSQNDIFGANTISSPYGMEILTKMIRRIEVSERFMINY